MKKLAIVFLGIIAAVTLLVGGFYIGQQMSQKNGRQTTPPPPEEPTAPTPSPTQENGTIEGSLSYPSEGIPEDMFVCAETTQGVQVSCTSTHIEDQKYEYGIGYMLEVEPGTYYIYSQLPDDEYKAYFTEFVPCGLTTECESHEKIEVEVKAGETTSGIDPIDWYIRVEAQ